MFPCEIQQRELCPTLSVRFKAPVEQLSPHFKRIYSLISEYLSKLNEKYAGPPFAIYHNMDMQNLDVEAGVPVFRPLATYGEIRAGEIPAGTFAVCHYTGPYSELTWAYERLSRFVVDEGYSPGNVVYEWYLTEPDVPAKDLKTDVVFPVTRVEHRETV